MTQGKDITAANLEKGAAALPDDIRQILHLFLADAGNDMKAFREQLITWHCTAMDRVSGWYKRKTQGWVLVIAILLCLAANADTILLAKALATNVILRESIVAQAEGFTRNQSRKEDSGPKSDSQSRQSDDDAQPTDVKATTNPILALRESGLPLGWSLNIADSRRFPADAWRPR